MNSRQEITTEEFMDGLRSVLTDQGIAWKVMDIPGVYECLSEHFNNDAIDKVKENRGG